MLDIDSNIVLTIIAGPHSRPLPSSPFHRLRRWRIASSFPARQAQPQHNTHLQQLRWRYTDCSDDFHGRCQLADIYGPLDEVGGQRHELELLVVGIWSEGAGGFSRRLLDQDDRGKFTGLNCQASATIFKRVDECGKASGCASLTIMILLFVRQYLTLLKGGRPVMSSRFSTTAERSIRGRSIRSELPAI